LSDPKPSEPVSPAPATPETPPTDTAPEYEFSDAQNRVIDDLAMAMVWVRVPLLVAGLLQGVIATGLALRLQRDGAHIVGVLGHAMAAVICFMLSGWLLRAAAAFSRITTTKGRDISHLMTGLRNLGSWFDLLAFFVKLYLALLGVLIVVMLIGLLTGFKEPSPVIVEP
jgi:Na+/melibiose symporter-like transporter